MFPARFQEQRTGHPILFTNPGANVQIRLFLEYIEKEESNIRSEKRVKKEMVDTFNSKVGELIKCLEVI